MDEAGVKSRDVAQLVVAGGEYDVRIMFLYLWECIPIDHVYMGRKHACSLIRMYM